MPIRNVQLSDIVANPFQPRSSFDQESLKSLAAEIKAEGFWSGSLQGRRAKNGKIELVFGHRRLKALKMLKMDSVQIELVDLTDAQMALRGLEENLQREGLSDVEKADAIKRAVEIARAERKAAGKPERGAMEEVATRLGLHHGWISELCRISVSMETKDRELIEAGYLAAKTALVAKDWGGEVYLRTLAKQGKEAAKPDSDISKPTHKTVAAMKNVVKEAPEPVREKLKELIVTGEVTTPKEAEQKARRLASERTRRNKLPPPDLKLVIVQWTHTLKDWNQQLKEVVPYFDYVEEVPSIAEHFRVELRKLIETANKLLS